MIERLASALADRYRIEREIGAGGMATVYLARLLMIKRASEESQMIVVHGWGRELKERVSGRR